jgi:serine/threonine protein kinase
MPKTYTTRKTKPYPHTKLRSSFLPTIKTSNIKITSLTKRRKLPPISKWKFDRETSGGTIFKIPNGKRIIIKPELHNPFPNAKIAAKPNNGGRHMLECINELMKRRANIEIPLGEIKLENGKKFYITEIKEGPVLRDHFLDAPKRKQKEIIREMAKELASLHKKGVIHGHPHLLNWILTKKGPKLIDVSGVKFKEEFPWKTNTGRTHTFDFMRENDIRYCFGDRENVDLLRNEYNKYY